MVTDRAKGFDMPPILNPVPASGIACGIVREGFLPKEGFYLLFSKPVGYEFGLDIYKFGIGLGKF